MIIITILDSIFDKRVVAAFIIFVTFVVFAGICLFAVAKTNATALVSSGLNFCNSLYHNIALKDILKHQCVQNVCSLTHCHFLNRCTASLSDIALF